MAKIEKSGENRDFCGENKINHVCGKAEDPSDFSGLGCLLLPNRRVFLQEASWITWGVLLSPLERPEPKFRPLGTKCHQSKRLSKLLWADYLARYSYSEIKMV